MVRRKKSSAASRGGKSSVGRKTRGRGKKAQSGPLLTGYVRLMPDGTGRVMPDGFQQRPIFLPESQMRRVLAGDRVTVSLQSGRSERRRGRVESVKPGVGYIVGVARWQGKKLSVQDVVSGKFWSVPKSVFQGRETINHGDAVVLEAVARDAKGLGQRIALEKVLGPATNDRVQIEMCYWKQGLPMRIPSAAAAEVAPLPQVDAKRCLGGKDKRQDLRNILHVTIDGEDAKDFDDAVAARVEKNNIRVWVSIADVSHYVTAGTALDAMSGERGLSAYFPHRVLPMLPERLANDLCSLRPREPRLTLTCQMDIDAQGNRLHIKIYPSLIESKARLTYTQVQPWLDGEKLGECAALDPQLPASFKALRQASSRLRARRQAAGSLTLDLPEPVYHLDDKGLPLKIAPLTRLASHELIEDLMVAANESVAEWMQQKNIPTVYRNHRPPSAEKLVPLVNWAKFRRHPLLVDMQEGQLGQSLVELLDALKGCSDESMGHWLVLRSMQQAQYEASNQGHFGLGSQAYLHFTSPIRRRADLLVHRGLKQFWSRQTGLKDLEAEAAHASVQERRLMSAERDIKNYLSCMVARDFVGHTMQGRVTGVMERGVFVRSDEYFFEGMLPRTNIEEIEKDIYQYDEQRMVLEGRRTRQRVALGDRFDVQLERVDVERRFIDFVLVSPLSKRRPQPTAKGGGRVKARK